MSYPDRAIIRRIKHEAGMTMVELLIATLIFSLVATAGFEFYKKMHLAAMAQDTVSELQFQGRNTLRDMRKTVRQAGFNLVAHAPYQIKGDTLAVYYGLSKPVDTILYYKIEFTTTEYSKMINQPTGIKLYKLMKKINSAAPMLYADYVNAFNAVQVDAKTLVMTITVQSDRPDDKYTQNNGYRTYTQGERVFMRNVT
jgi:prepilin-type N-terminal cleavage/methylation domain-containing protein